MENGKTLYYWFFISTVTITRTMEAAMKYVSDIIGNQYKDWQPGDSIYISTQTGTGKTSFIINKLIKEYCSEGKKVLYLVNRSALRKQLELEIKNTLSYDEQKNIVLTSYQTLEEMYSNFAFNKSSFDYCEGVAAGKNVYSTEYVCDYVGHTMFSNCDFNIGNIKLSEFYCVICDECHYYLADSNYNTRTIFSYNLVKWFFSDKIRIYISATIDNISNYIKNDNLIIIPKNEKGIDVMRKSKNYRFLQTDWFAVNTKICKEYSKSTCMGSVYNQRNYDYADLYMVDSEEQIVDNIFEFNGRWLIFVDSKSFGRSLKRKINERNKEEQKKEKKEHERDKEYVPTFIEKKVVFMSSEYYDSPEEYRENLQIIKNQQQTVDVLIATSVYDNGINLKDELLNNIVIMADNEVEFIQMLGRKRIDESRVNLFLYRYDKNHFTSRLTNMSRKIEYLRTIYNGIISEVSRAASNSNNIAYCNYIELKSLVYWHSIIIQSFQDNSDIIKSAFVPVGKYLFLNPLSLRNLENMCEEFKRIVDLFDKDGITDKNTFIKEQLKWLNIEDKNAMASIILSREQRAIQRIVSAIDDKILQGTNSMLKEQCATFKSTLKEDLVILYSKANLPNEKKKKIITYMGQNDRPLSAPEMTILREQFGLPFEIKVSNGFWNFIRV